MSAFPQIKIKHNIGNTIDVPNQIDVRAFTYIGTNVPIGITSLPVDNAMDFTAGAILLLLSSMGAENAEFGVVSAHTDQEFTLSATEMPHNRGDLVQEISYDQIVLYKASVVGGPYALIETKSFQVTQQQTIFFDQLGNWMSCNYIHQRNSWLCISHKFKIN